MKKSIFLFFAAILCAIGASAATKTIYFKSQQWWHKDNAASAAYYWGTGGNANAWPGTRMTKVAGETNMWSIEIDTDKYQNIIFTRVNGSGTVQDWGAKTTDQAIPTDGKNFFTLGNSEVWGDPGATGTWSTYTPPTEPVIPEYYITGTLAGGWTGNEVKMTYNETTKIHSHTFTAVTAGEEKKFKVTDGTWDASWGGDAVSPAIEGVTKDGDGNAVFTLSTGGDVTITFDGTNIQLTTTGSFTPVETFDYYVVGSFNGWNTADAAYGMTKEGDVYKKEVTFAKDAQFKVCDGTWGAAWGAQNLGDNKYKELDGTDNIVMMEEKTFTIIFNPAQNLLTFEGLTPEAVVTYDYYVIGSINGWATKDENFGMTDENADGVYEKEVTLAVGDNEIKVNNGTWDDGCHWGFGNLSAKYEGVEEGKDGEGKPNGNIKITLATQQTITVKFDKNTSKITLDGLTESTAPTKYYIVGTFTENWTNGHADYELTLDGEVYKKSLTLDAGEHMFKITDGTWNDDATWGYSNVKGSYVGMEEGTNDEGNKNNNIKLTLDAETTFTVKLNLADNEITFDGLEENETETLVYYVEVPAGTEDCYIAGQMNNWEFERMTQVDATHWTITYDNVLKTTEYKYACQASWDYKELDKEGKEVANRTWTELDKVEKWAEPAEVKCYLMGNGDWVNGVEMEEDGAQFKLLAHHIYAPFKFKFGETWTADVENTDFEGLGSEDDGNGGTNITLPEGLYDFYFKKDTKKVYIALVGYARNVTNKYGTICLPYASASTAGATFFEVVGQEAGKVYLGSVNTLAAGVPYIFEKSASQIKVVYTGEKETTAGSANGLVGTFADNTTVPNDAYILYGGAFCPNNDPTKPNKINAYRAYLNLSAVDGGKPNQMPGRRYIGMSVQGENGATGVEDIFSTDAPVKVIENGQLIIIRDGVKYNVQGQVIK